MKSTTYQVGILESIPIFETKHLKMNRLQNDHRIQNKLAECKIFELKYENRKLSNVQKYNKVRLVSADLASINF